ncbi:MAG: hypothetical protein ACI8UO_005110 [Verrucomicrobiales bacterium]
MPDPFFFKRTFVYFWDQPVQSLESSLIISECSCAIFLVSRSPSSVAARSSSFDRFSHAIAVYRVARREAVALEHERVEMQFPRPFDLGVRGFEQVDRDLAWTFDFFVFSRIGRLSARLSSCCHAESGKGGFPNECSSWC